MLLAEEVNLQIVQAREEVKDNSACDNSSNKMQRHFDKIHSVPIVVQHHTGDKNQGNSVDKIEAVSLELEDNFHAKIQDILIPEKEISDNSIEDGVQICSKPIQASFSNEVKTSYALVENYLDENQHVSSEAQDNFPTEIQHYSVLAQKVSDNVNEAKSVVHTHNVLPATNSNEEQNYSNANLEDKYVPLKPKRKSKASKAKISRKSGFSKVKNIAKQASANEVQNNFFIETTNITKEVQKDSVTDALNENINDKAQCTDKRITESVQVPNVSDNKFISNFIDKVESNTEDDDFLLSNIYDIFSEDNYINDKINATSAAVNVTLYDQNVNTDTKHENLNVKEKILYQKQEKPHKQSQIEANDSHEIQRNFITGRRLYSHVVQGYNDSVQTESEVTDNKIISNFVDKTEPVFVEVKDDLSDSIEEIFTKLQSSDKTQFSFVTELDRLYEQFIDDYEATENINRLHPIQGQVKFYEGCNFGHESNRNYKIRDNFNRSPKLYSDAVRGSGDRIQEHLKALNYERNELIEYVNKLKHDCNRDMKMICDEDIEISEDETDESSINDMHASSDGDIDDNSDVEIEDSFISEIGEDFNGRKAYHIVSKFYSEDNEDPFQRYSEFGQKKKLTNTNETKQLVPKYQIEYLPQTGRLAHSGEFLVLPQYWRTMWDHAIPLQLHAFIPISQNYESFDMPDEFKDLFEEEEFMEEKSPISIQISIPNSAEMLQNLINQKSTTQQKKTGNFGYFFRSKLKLREKRKHVFLNTSRMR